MKHNQIAYSHFVSSTLLGLSSRGIFVLGLQAIPFPSPTLGTTITTGYIVSDNETGKVWTADQVIEAARTPYLAGIADDVEEAETNLRSFASQLREFGKVIVREEIKRVEGKTIPSVLLEEYRETLASLVIGAHFLVDIVEGVEKDFLSLYPEEEKEEEVGKYGSL